MVELERKETSYIKLKDLKDGQIAEIIEGPESKYLNIIIQRYKDILISVGQASGLSWSYIFNTTSTDTWRLRVLEEGEKIIIKNNN